MNNLAIVDSQCHVSASWYEPVESLRDQMTRHGVQQAVLIQMLGQTDNTYQQECLVRFPGRFASVVLVDPAGADASSALRQLAAAGAAGIRLRPSARSPGPDPLSIWRAASECGVAVSCVGNSTAFLDPEFAKLIESLPGLDIVLEHLGGTSQPDTDDSTRALRLRVCELARFENVYLKLPGLGELLPRRMPPSAGSLFESRQPSVLLEALRAFGAHRLMWGSDFPPVSSREGYGNSLQGCLDALDHVTADERLQIFGGTARRVFKLPEPRVGDRPPS
jgi:L-fuconolactonase